MNGCLRFVFLLALISFARGAICDSNDSENHVVTDFPNSHAIINAFISNPTIGERLRDDELLVGRITRESLQPGVTEYLLYVHTCAMCDPGRAKTGFVTITEDVRPTYKDAAIEYSVSFSIKNVN